MELNSVLAAEEAQANWSKLMREIAKGRSFEITLDGKIVALMGPTEAMRKQLKVDRTEDAEKSMR